MDQIAMGQVGQIANTISMTMGAAWASGINLYAVFRLVKWGSVGKIRYPSPRALARTSLLVDNF